MAAFHSSGVAFRAVFVFGCHAQQYRLPDLAQKKLAIESALVLGNRDLKAGSLYRDILRDIAHHGNSLLNALADGPMRTQQAQDMLAYLSFVNTFQPTGGFPPLYEGCFYLVTVSREGAGNELREWVPLIQEQCRVMAERMQRFEPKLGIYESVQGGICFKFSRSNTNSDGSRTNRSCSKRVRSLPTAPTAPCPNRDGF
jgi:hypothetical protein